MFVSYLTTQASGTFNHKIIETFNFCFHSREFTENKISTKFNFVLLTNSTRPDSSFVENESTCSVKGATSLFKLFNSRVHTQKYHH